MKKDTTSLNLQDLEYLFQVNTDALTPRVMRGIFGEEPTSKALIPSFLTSEKMTMLHNQGVGVITFIPRSCNELNKQFNCQQANGKNLMYDTSWYKNSKFWLLEKPRSGLCLMKLGHIQNSANNNYLDQTIVLADYIENILPEFKKTSFWISCRKELNSVVKEVSQLILIKEYVMAIYILSKIKINQFFRPRFSELLQQLIAYDYKNHIHLQGSYSIWSNSINDQKDKFIIVGSFLFNEGIPVIKSYPNNKDNTLGTSFIMSFDEVLAEI